MPHRQRFYGEFHDENELAFAQVHGSISCAKCKALGSGFWFFKSPSIARLGLELEVQTSSDGRWFTAELHLSSEMILDHEMSFPWLCFWALGFPSVTLGPIFDKYETDLVTFALFWGRFLVLPHLVQIPTCKRCLLAFPFCHYLFTAEWKINPYSSQKNKMYLLSRFLINSGDTFLIRMCQQCWNGVLT